MEMVQQKKEFLESLNFASLHNLPIILFVKIMNMQFIPIKINDV